MAHERRGRAGCAAKKRAAAPLAAALSLALTLLGCGAGDAHPRPQRLILVTLDTLRLDAFIGTTGRPTGMPITRRWAEGATVFRNYYSVTSSTQPTHATLFCGNQPWEHGVTANGMLLPGSEVTLAERLVEAGWSTSAVVASGPLHASLGFDQGFEQYTHGFTLEEGAQDKQGEAHSFARGDHVSDLALEALDDCEGQRQFLWVHYFDPHAPYGDSVLHEQMPSNEMLSPMSILVRIKNGQSEASDLLEAARDFYYDDVGFMDRQLARLLERLAADAEQFETHIVLVSDHGELFGEGDSIGHGKRLLPELLRVPLVILSPRIAAGQREEAVGSTDVAATLCDLAGLDASGAEGAGQSLVEPLDPARTVYGMRRTFAQTYEERRVDNTLHALEMHSFFAFDGKRLFTGSLDGIWRDDGPRELREGQRREELTQRFAQYQARIEGLSTESSTDEDTLRALEQLGYTR